MNPVSDFTLEFPNCLCSSGAHGSGFPHPEVESVPRLLLRVDAVGLGSANSPHIGLMALFEVNELDRNRRSKLSFL